MYGAQLHGSHSNAEIRYHVGYRVIKMSMADWRGVMEWVPIYTYLFHDTRSYSPSRVDEVNDIGILPE